MSIPELRTITITNFRSVRGEVAIPLNAPVVLLHGPNGVGKSTVMSALELALTGRVSGVEGPDSEHLVHRGSSEANIGLVTSEGNVDFTIKGRDVQGTPVLSDADARFFEERCYLEQRTLGRLLELYEEPAEGGDSPLTTFVKDLIGLDELDALIDGLYPATDKRRAKRLVPEFGDLDRELKARRKGLETLESEKDTHSAAVAEDRAQLKELLSVLDAPPSLESDPNRADGWLRQGNEDEERALVDLVGARRELTALTNRVHAVAKRTDAAKVEALEAAASTAQAAADGWRRSHGKALEDVLDGLRRTLPGIPAVGGAGDPEELRTVAFDQVGAELDRVKVALAADEEARVEFKRLDQQRTTAQRRLTGLDEQISNSGTASAAEELAQALASLIPHVHTEDCPVCNRNYSEISPEPLSAHLATRVSELAARAEQLQELAKARTTAVSDLRRIETDLGAVARQRMADDARLKAKASASRLGEALRQLRDLAPGVADGASLVRQETEANRDLQVARDRDRTAVELRSAIEAVAQSVGQSAPDTTTAVATAIADLSESVEALVRGLQARSRQRADAIEAVKRTLEGQKEQVRLQRTIQVEKGKVDRIANAVTEVERRRAVVWNLRDEAESGRADVVRRVFTDSLNRAWRDLFVRLAPEEPFVPVFRVPDTSHGVAATLETMHRDGNPGGPPAAMLSAGNLNTAALTLFLALNLSVTRRLPWVLLDDPVQSMDEVHVAQFAALLRTLSRQQGRHVVIAVHERALFEYLALELSPANKNEDLITVELSGAPDGSTEVEPDFQAYVKDRAFETA